MNNESNFVTPNLLKFKDIIKKTKKLFALFYLLLLIPILFLIIGIILLVLQISNLAVGTLLSFCLIFAIIYLIVSIIVNYFYYKKISKFIIQNLYENRFDFELSLTRFICFPLLTCKELLWKIDAVIKNTYHNKNLNSLVENTNTNLSVNKNDFEKIEYQKIYETNRLYIRHFLDTDLDLIYQYRNDKRCYFYQSYQATSKTEIQNLITENVNKTLLSSVGNFATILKETNQMVGEIFIANDSFTKKYYIGFTIIPAFQRNGYAYEMVNQLLKIVSNQLKDYVFVCTVYEKNIKSVNLIKKLEFNYTSFYLDQKGKVLVYSKKY